MLPRRGAWLQLQTVSGALMPRHFVAIRRGLLVDNGAERRSSHALSPEHQHSSVGPSPGVSTDDGWSKALN